MASSVILNRRALHFVFKIGNRSQAIKFFRDILGMKVLRHEEFEEGCKATCNGPYDGKWSKTMIGYGAEDNHFVMELTYNYGIGTYKLGSDFLGMTIQDDEIVNRAKQDSWSTCEHHGLFSLKAPDGYPFYVKPEARTTGDPVQKVTLASTDMEKSLEYWTNILRMKVYSKSDKAVVLGYGDSQCKLELEKVASVDRGTSFGRIAFSCPRSQLADIQTTVRDNNYTVLTPLVSLDTPGKATVEVVILADPDGHEICFVGDEAFRELSQVVDGANDLLNKAMTLDHSDDWFAKKGKTKAAAAI